VLLSSTAAVSIAWRSLFVARYGCLLFLKWSLFSSAVIRRFLCTLLIILGEIFRILMEGCLMPVLSALAFFCSTTVLARLVLR
jgi:hypothetical protein